jgi:hypothetical protein
MPLSYSLSAALTKAGPRRLHSIPEPERSLSSPTVTKEPRLAVLIGPATLAAAVAGGLLIPRSPQVLVAWVLGAMLLIALGWVVVSSLHPARPDRRCPACTGQTLVRADELSTRGLTCTRCSWSDEQASAFLFAEEAGGLESLVLADRRERDMHRGRRGRRPVEEAR